MDSRETRYRAKEIKFMTDVSMRDSLIDWARKNLEPDGHGAGEHRDLYSTTSLYFETPTFDVYQRKGSFGRAKYRVRRYGDSDVVFLERKFRTARLLAKRRTTVPLQDIERIGDPNPDQSWHGYWFYRRINARKLRPLIQFSYDRIARVGTASHGPFRMTVDSNLHVLPMPTQAFLLGVGMPVLTDKCIVEMKYCMALPAILKGMVEDVKLEIQKVSKFRVGLRSLDYPLPKDADEDAVMPNEVSGLEEAEQKYFD